MCVCARVWYLEWGVCVCVSVGCGVCECVREYVRGVYFACGVEWGVCEFGMWRV